MNELNKIPLSQKFSSLFHYTAPKGLSGILNSQTLWATNYEHLNDSKEILLAKDFLEVRWKPSFFEKFADICKNISNIDEILNRRGGFESACNQEIHEHIDRCYNTLLHYASSGIYITSFCTHTEKYEYENGLLSQWRGYGRDGGYAIELETHELEKINSKISFGYGSLAEVAYSNKPEILNPHIDIFTKYMNEFYSAAVIERDWDKANTHLMETFEPFVHIVSRYKHRAFEEEKEIRIFCAPANLSEIRKISSEGLPQSESFSFKHFERSGKLVPYIDLYENLKKADSDFRLPIKRIIVGPHRDKEKRADALRVIADNFGISPENITVSDIPYIEP